MLLFGKLHEIFGTLDFIDEHLVGIVGEARKLMGVFFDLFATRRDHFKAVRVDKPLVLLELLGKGLEVEVKVGLAQAEKLVVVDFL